MTDNEKLSCLIDRPCTACKFHKEEGCSKWSCVFEEKSGVPKREKGEWIPVSERLPEEDGDYMLWGKMIEDDEEEYQFIGGYDSGCEEFGVWEMQYDRTTLGCLGSDFLEYDRVIAWQPLPEPYKAESEKE